MYKKYNSTNSLNSKLHTRLPNIDSNFQFDNKRREVESWLGRMEVWLCQMGPVGSTANVLEAQIREQKVSNLTQILNYFKVDIIWFIPVLKEPNLHYHKF